MVHPHKTSYPMIRQMTGNVEKFDYQTRELMLWSQIKLTSYAFSDLQLTGEFDYRPGTGRFKKILLRGHYRTGAG